MCYESGAEKINWAKLLKGDGGIIYLEGWEIQSNLPLFLWVMLQW